MRPITLALVLAVGSSSAGMAQQAPDKPAVLEPRLDLFAGNNHIDANGPPGDCQCFQMDGGIVAATYHFTHMFGVTVEATGAHANDISILHQNLTLIAVLAGPRFIVTWHRFSPYGQILGGFARGSDSYFPVGTGYKTSAGSRMISAGGGLDVGLTRRISLRALNVEYVRSAFPNGETDYQNNLLLGGGFVFKFGSQKAKRISAPAPPPPRRSEISFSCSTNVANVEEGQTLQIVGHAFTEPDHFLLDYTWDSSDGPVQGTGRLVGLNTAGFALGQHTVKGHVSMVSDSATSADCLATFRVIPRTSGVVAPRPPAPAPAEIPTDDAVFHQNVRDALFDYDSSEIRPDAQAAINIAAVYLQLHPQIGVLIAGYSDERGSAEYNIALSARRANSARQALIDAGVSSDRLQIISYGKEIQVCNAQDEKCWQQNRRAAFNMHH